MVGQRPLPNQASSRGIVRPAQIVRAAGSGRGCVKTPISSLRGGEADEAIYSKQQLTDCFVSLAMTPGEFSHSLGRKQPLTQ
jgi:hypothetical protein